MAQYHDAYSRFVTWAKIVLPLVALGLLSTLFLIARSREPQIELPYSDSEIEALSTESRISAPSYSAVTSDGARVSLWAELARLDVENPDLAHIEQLSAEILTEDGLQINLGADQGSYDAVTMLAQLRGDAHAQTSTGYLIHSDHLVSEDGGALVRSPVPVHAEGPFGSLDAGEMELRRQTNDDEHYLLVFKGGVKLLYQPQPE